MSRGGYRVGAGRPAGAPNKLTLEGVKSLSEIAKTYTEDAIEALVEVAKNGRTDASRVSAATALLDRAYGKPALQTGQEMIYLPPIVIQSADREERKG